MNKKMYIAILGIIILNSCSSLNAAFSTYDPYEGKKPKKTRTVQNKKKETNVKEKTQNTEKKEVTQAPYVKVEPIKTQTVNNIEEVNYTTNEKKILKALKEEYSLIDSVENIEKQTTAAIIKLRKEKNKNLKALEFLIAVNETLKKTKTNSYILAVSRTVSTYNNWGKK